QAPPLDGVWATAPYFHNGSAPTAYEVLNSKARPTRYQRSANPRAFDERRLGLVYEPVEKKILEGPGAESKRNFFDTSRFGAGNGGHTFGDGLSDTERYAIIEYLKTL